MPERTETQRDYTRFVIVSAARTGSNMLASALNTSPHITCFRELFSRAAGFIDYHVDGYDGRDPEDMRLRDADFAAFLERRIFTDHPREVRAVGFKMPYEHFANYPEVLSWLVARPEIRVLHLRRRNLLRSLVSVQIARETGGWVVDRPFTLRRALQPRYVAKSVRHPLRAATALRRLLRPYFGGGQEPRWKSRRQPVALTEEECRSYFAWAERTAAEYDAAFAHSPLLTLSYEDLVDDRRRTLQDVQRFLEVPGAPLFLATEQQNPEPLPELVANYDELRAAFAGTPYAPFFD